MLKNKRFKRVVSGVVMLCVTASLFFCCCVPVSARVANGSTYFKYAAATFRGVEGEVALKAAQFDYATNGNNDVYFRTYLPEKANMVAFRMENTAVFNDFMTQWYSVLPSMSNAAATNITSYTFTIVERSYSGNITSISNSDFIYQVVFSLSTDSKTGAGVFNILSEYYGARWAARYNNATVGPIPSFNPSTDVIISLYSGLRTDFIVNFNLIVGCGSGNINDYKDIHNGYNAAPSVPEEWQNELSNDRNTYQDIDIKLHDVLNFMQNPATTLNTAINKTSATFDWPEFHLVMGMLNRFFGIPLVNTMAWVIAFFGTVFSLFNLGISFVPSSRSWGSHSGSGPGRGGK